MLSPRKKTSSSSRRQTSRGRTSSRSVGRSRDRGKSSSFTARLVAEAKVAYHPLFLPLIILTFISWVVYRSVFVFPVWFDESIGKAIFFGLPVWLYVVVSNYKGITETLSFERMQSGLLQGLAFGGLFGFAAALTSLWSRGLEVAAAPLFTTSAFWYQFGLALLTAFWESLFFFGFIMSVIGASRLDWSVLRQIVVVAFIFMIYHLPVILAGTADLTVIGGYAALLFAFGLGQAFIFSRSRNLYTLIVVHAIWGMVLYIHTL